MAVMAGMRVPSERPHPDQDRIQLRSARDLLRRLGLLRPPPPVPPEQQVLFAPASEPTGSRLGLGPHPELSTDGHAAAEGRRWRPTGSRIAGKDLLALAGFALLTLLLFRKAWRSPTTVWVGGPGDPPYFMWLLRWLPYALADGQNPLFTNHLNFPDGVNLMWNTASPLPAFLLSPITLTLGPVFSYNLLITAGVASSGCCAYLMLRRYVAARLAAFAGALLYGFSPYMYSHADGHPNLAAAFVPPLLFLLLDEILVRQRRSALAGGLLLGILTFVQLLISEELLATQALVAAVGLGLLIVLHPDGVRARARHAAAALAVGLITSLALAAFPLAFQFAGPRRVRSGSLWGPDIYVSDLLGFFIPTDHLHWSPGWTTQIIQQFTDACCPSEWSAYLGLPLIIFLIAVTVRFWSTPLVRFASLLATAVAILSMGPHLHVQGFVTPLTLPFAIIAELPLLGNVLAGRLMLYTYLMAGLLVAVALDSLLAERRSLVAVGLAVLVLGPLLPNLEFPATDSNTPLFFRSSAVRQLLDKDSVVLVAPFARDTSTSGPMLWQAEADMRYRMPEGYALGPDRAGRFSYLPIPTPLSETMQEIQGGVPVPVLDASARGELIADLVRAEVSAVIVGPMNNEQAMIAFFRQLLGSEPVAVGGVRLWADLNLVGQG
jgi:hypothetical protein